MNFTDKIHPKESISPRNMLVNQLIDNGQFLIGEQPKLISNKLSTFLLVFPSDKQPGREALLNQKVDDAIKYAASFTDVERLNALQYLPGTASEEDSLERWYLTLGLYLYFADECSRKNPKDSQMTFLSALREADAKLPGDKGYHSMRLGSKVLKALEIAGIDTDTNINILEEWFRNGDYTIAGEHHRAVENDGKLEMRGAYAKLAEQIVKDYRSEHERGVIVGINEAISYALGNKEHMRQLQERIEQKTQHLRQSGAGEKTIQKACDKILLEHVMGTIDTSGEIKSHVDRGDSIRRERIMHEIQNISEMPLSFHADVKGAAEKQDALRPVAEAILSYYPLEAMQFMLRDRQTFVYDDHSDISHIYPEGRLPAEREDVSMTSRRSIAARLSRYRVGFFSNGRRMDPTPIDEETKYMRVAMSSLHELMHIAYRRMTPEERDRLDTLVTQVSGQLRPGDDKDNIGSKGPPGGYAFFGHDAPHTRSLEQNSLPQILDYRNDYYDGYRQDPSRLNTIDSRREEVICNVFGLMHTEFRDNDSLLRQPPAELPAIGELTKAIDDIFKNVVEQSRKEGFIRYARSSAKENAQTPG